MYSEDVHRGGRQKSSLSCNQCIHLKSALVLVIDVSSAEERDEGCLL
jgi:hypothetical protein